MESNTISKSEMLARIVESGDVPFRLVFVKGTGAEEGQLAEKVCYYGAPNPRDRQAPTGGHSNRKDRATHLESNTIPLTEFGSRRMLTPWISHIIKFNGKKVIH